MRSVLAIVVVSAALVVGCARHDPPTEIPRPVALAQATPSGGEAAVFAGEVKPRHEADLAFRIGGKLVARSVDAGARVRKGQVLARLDPSDTGLQAEAARAQVKASETEYDFARGEFDRYRGLFEQKFISASALDAKKSAMDANRAKYEQAKANLAVAQNQAAYAMLVAPDDGVVTSVGAEAGQVVAAGQTVLRLAREDEREVAIAVPEARVGELSGAKQIGVVLVANPRKTYAARVREIAPGVDPVTRTFAVRVSVLDADPALQWGMTANVVVATGVDAAARGTLLPLPSLYHTPDERPAVWIYDANEGKVTLRPVVVAQYREDGVVIGSGVAAGEWVVAAGANKLREGQPVRPYEAPGHPVPPPPAAQNPVAPRG
jgi:RND family efflux transporter MFP subunit